jgi:hypothetical protein
VKRWRGGQRLREGEVMSRCDGEVKMKREEDER